MRTCKNILVLNGPNLNLLGQREPQTYGKVALPEIEARLLEMARLAGAKLTAFQSNSEAELVGRIHAAAGEGIELIIINPAAYAHTSVALQDALHTCEIPVIEVHMTNTFKREAYRHTDYTAQVATAQINGCGANGYRLALEQVRHLLDKA